MTLIIALIMSVIVFVGSVVFELRSGKTIETIEWKYPFWFTLAAFTATILIGIAAS